MPKLPTVSGKQVQRALEKLGFIFKRQRGSHVVLRRGSSVCVVPIHRELDRGTLGSVIKQAGVNEKEFIEALR